MQIIDNVNNLLGDDIRSVLDGGSKLKIAASCFSIYAFEALKKEHLLKNEDNFEEGVSGLLEKSILAIQKINREICKDKSIGRDRQIKLDRQR